MMRKYNNSNFLVRVFFATVLCLVCLECIVGKKFKRMEKFEYERFKKDYYNKNPVVIGGLKPYFANTTKDLFRLCGTQQVNLRRMPNLKTSEAVALNQSIHPCGADCYGVYRELVCKELLENLTLPEEVSFDDVTMTLSKEGMETPKTILDTAFFQYMVAGVEEWRVLQNFYDDIDLFHQQYYSDKLTPGEALYLPPNTLSQQRSLTRLSISLQTQIGEPVHNVEVEMVDGEIVKSNI